MITITRLSHYDAPEMSGASCSDDVFISIPLFDFSRRSCHWSFDSHNNYGALLVARRRLPPGTLPRAQSCEDLPFTKTPNMSKPLGTCENHILSKRMLLLVKPGRRVLVNRKQDLRVLRRLPPGILPGAQSCEDLRVLYI